MSDGGREALAGFLYQIIGSAGIAARAYGGRNEAGSIACDLVVKARVSRVRHEAYGEDLIFEQPAQGGSIGTAIQFKHSRSPQSHPITPSELREIIHTFDRSRRNATPSLTVQGYALVTNRGLSLEAKAIYAYRNPNTTFSKLAAGVLRGLFRFGRAKKEIVKEYGSADAAKKAFYEVFRQLEIYSDSRTAHWVTALRDYTTERGLVPEEFDAAIHRLVGAAVDATSIGDMDFSAEWLNKHLLNLPDARTLVVAAQGNTACRVAATQVGDYLHNSLDADETILCRRGLLDQVALRVREYPLVVLVGGGGCGKSVLALQYLREQGTRRFIVARQAGDLSAGWFGSSFNRWRSSGHSDNLPVDPNHLVLRRLLNANPQQEQPIIVAALDGLDETPPGTREEAKQVLRDRYRERNRPATFVCLVTVRGDNREMALSLQRLLSEWLLTDGLPSLSPIGVVQVGPFTDDELQAAAARLTSRVSGRLRGTLKVFSAEARQDEEFGADLAQPTAMVLVDAVGHAAPGTLGGAVIETLRSLTQPSPVVTPSPLGGQESLTPVVLASLVRLGEIDQPEGIRQYLALRHLDGVWRLAPGAQLQPLAASMIGPIYVRHPEQYAPLVGDLILAAGWPTITQLMPFLEASPAPAPTAVQRALTDRVNRNSPEVGEPELLPLFVRLATEDQICTAGMGGLSNWPPQVRSALADAIGQSGSARLAERCSGIFLLLMNDGQYGVRRAAYRAFARLNQTAFASLIELWAGMTEERSRFPIEQAIYLDIRRRAAEGSGWLQLIPTSGAIPNLKGDPDPDVREAFNRSQRERRERMWAADYLREILAVRDQESLFDAWRYGAVLSKVGDDDVLERLDLHRRSVQLTVGVRHWLARLMKEIRSRWDEVTRGWPQAWFSTRGRVEQLTATIEGHGTHQCWLWYSPSREDSGVATWGGWLPDTSLSTHENQIELQATGRRSGTILVTQTIAPDGPTYFIGNGPYPVSTGGEH